MLLNTSHRGYHFTISNAVPLFHLHLHDYRTLLTFLFITWTEGLNEKMQIN